MRQLDRAMDGLLDGIWSARWPLRALAVGAIVWALWPRPAPETRWYPPIPEPGASGFVLISGGAGSTPAWAPVDHETARRDP